MSVLDANGDTVWQQFHASAPTPSLSIDLNATGVAVRIELNGILSLAEVQVFGAEASNGNGGGLPPVNGVTSDIIVAPIIMLLLSED